MWLFLWMLIAVVICDILFGADDNNDDNEPNFYDELDELRRQQFNKTKYGDYS